MSVKILFQTLLADLILLSTVTYFPFIFSFSSEVSVACVDHTSPSASAVSVAFLRTLCQVQFCIILITPAEFSTAPPSVFGCHMLASLVQRVEQAVSDARLVSDTKVQ